MMMEKWLQLQEKTAALSMRERGILTAMSLVVLLVIWLQFVFTPIEEKSGKTSQQIRLATTQVAEQSERIATLAASLQNNPNDALRSEQETLQDTLAELRSKIEDRLDNLIPPEKMADLMRDVLSDYQGLKLVKARNLPVEPIRLQTTNTGQGGETNSGDNQAVIFSHGFEMVLTGGYFQTLAFLQRLEEMEGFYWRMMDYTVDAYPKAKITIQLSTMSLEEDWIGV